MNERQIGRLAVFLLIINREIIFIKKKTSIYSSFFFVLGEMLCFIVSKIFLRIRIFCIALLLLSCVKIPRILLWREGMRVCLQALDQKDFRE